MTVTRIGELDVRECRELLAGGEVGRVALCTAAGPQIVPVSYVVDGASVVFRTTPYGVLGRNASRGRVAFEVDEVDRVSRVGLERGRDRAPERRRGPRRGGVDPSLPGP